MEDTRANESAALKFDAIGIELAGIKAALDRREPIFESMRDQLASINVRMG